MDFLSIGTTEGDPPCTDIHIFLALVSSLVQIYQGKYATPP